jgi:hypothetical protein
VKLTKALFQRQTRPKDFDDLPNNCRVAATLHETSSISSNILSFPKIVEHFKIFMRAIYFSQDTMKGHIFATINCSRLLYQFCADEMKYPLLSGDGAVSMLLDGNIAGAEPLTFEVSMKDDSQVIPADVDHIDFTWRARPGSSVPYKLTFIHTPGPAMAAPTVNISQTGLVPTYPDKFRLLFPCTGKVAAQVETLLQVRL